MSRRRSELAAGAALVVLLAWHTATKVPLGLVPEMLWCCHLASGLTALAFLAGRPRWAVAFGMFHVGCGLEGYLLDTWVGGTTTVDSLLLHLLTPGFALWAARRVGVPTTTVPSAVGIYLAGLLLGRLCPPALNVNMAFHAHDVWPPSTPLGVSIVANLLGVAFGVAVADQLTARSWGRAPRDLDE